MLLFEFDGREREMITKKIRALKDFQLKTCGGIYFLSKGEVKRVDFKDRGDFEAHLKLGIIVEAGMHEEERKEIPVVLPEVSEEEVVAVEPEEKVEEPEEIPVLSEAPLTAPSLENVPSENIINRPKEPLPEHGVDDTPDLPGTAEPDAPWKEGTPEFEGKQLKESGIVLPENPPEISTSNGPEVEEISVEEWREMNPDAPELQPGERTDENPEVEVEEIPKE